MGGLKEFCWLDWIAWGGCCLFCLLGFSHLFIYLFVYLFTYFEGYKLKMNPLFIGVLGAAVSRLVLPGHDPVLSASVGSGSLLTATLLGLRQPGFTCIGMRSVVSFFPSPPSEEMMFSLDS